MPNTPQILVDATDSSALESARPYLSEDLYSQIAERVQALAGSDDELNPQPLPPFMILRHWCGYWPVDVFILDDELGESIGINLGADTLTAGEHEALTPEVRKAVHAHAKKASAKLPSPKIGSPHVFIGLTFEDQ